jgi:hypothetical protein
LATLLFVQAADFDAAPDVPQSVHDRFTPPANDTLAVRARRAPAMRRVFFIVASRGMS